MDWTKLVSTVAPWIGTALGGPLGGMAVEAAANALGLTDKTVDSVKQALAGVTPDQMLALKKADQDFALQMQALGFKNTADMEAIAAGDRDSARRMQTAKPSPVPALLTCFVVGAFTATLVLLLKFDVPATNRDIVVYMIGQLSGGFTSALAFWLGTTRDSGRKTELLAQSAPATSP
ncbi:hypothetical protein P26218_21 [Rhodoferax phage P26218]|jgi:hypothetical protein|uniref:hypothetical protein n=1 Tax=Rhodoferax phage P26218 TaxID=1636270 RepID=UPI0005FEB396|nr:hypothetical protein AXJ08_gp21 [Rhodoferax phage P26218]AKA60324.1 hypothetical protein P26218_21 [Rhodoferax phage P26218]